MEKAGLKNENLVKKISVSGSLVLTQRNLSNNLTLIQESNIEDGVISGKLVKPGYNNDELIKSIDTKIFELIPQAPPELPDTVLRSVYNPVTQSVIDLTAEVARLNNFVLSLENKISQLEIVSESLRVDNDAQKLLAATSQNQASQTNLKVAASVTDLQNSIQKATAEAIQRVSLKARNESLQQEIDALRTQINAKNEAVAAGGVSTGQLSTIVFEKGDPSKLQGGNPQMIGMDYKDGKFTAPGNDYGKTFQTYFEVVNGPKDTSVSIKFSGDVAQSIWSFDFSLPVVLKANETKRFLLSKQSQYFVGLPGSTAGGFLGLGRRKPHEYNFTMQVVVTAVDNSKTEQKDFTFHIYKY